MRVFQLRKISEHEDVTAKTQRPKWIIKMDYQSHVEIKILRLFSYFNGYDLSSQTLPINPKLVQ